MSNGRTPTPNSPLPLPPGSARLPVSGSDLLLILIFGLGSVRFLSLLLVGFGGDPGAGSEMHQVEEQAADRHSSSTMWVVVGVILFQTAIILGLVRSFVIGKYGLRWADLGLRPVERIWYRRAIIVAILMLPMVAVLNTLLIPQVTHEPFRNPQIDAIAPMGFDWPTLIVMLLSAGIVAPFSEEIAFRGLLFPWIRERIGMIPAAVLSGLCFAVLHGVVPLIPALTLVGIVLAVLYQRCGSLWPVILAHSAFNSIMIVMLYAVLAAGIDLS